MIRPYAASAVRLLAQQSFLSPAPRMGARRLLSRSAPLRNGKATGHERPVTPTGGSSDLPWILGAVAFTIPAVSLSSEPKVVENWNQSDVVLSIRCILGLVSAHGGLARTADLGSPRAGEQCFYLACGEGRARAPPRTRAPRPIQG